MKINLSENQWTAIIDAIDYSIDIDRAMMRASTASVSETMAAINRLNTLSAARALLTSPQAEKALQSAD
jgi:hypothetical protein